MTDLNNLDTDGLKSLIIEAQASLEAKQKAKRKDVIAQIRELAASANLIVEISDGEKIKKSSSVEAKYRNPSNALDTWTGRGLAPKWMKALLDAGHAKEEFLI